MDLPFKKDADTFQVEWQEVLSRSRSECRRSGCGSTTLPGLGARIAKKQLLEGDERSGCIITTSHDRIHPKWWFMWGIAPEPPYFRPQKYHNSPRKMLPGHAGVMNCLAVTRKLDRSSGSKSENGWLPPLNLISRQSPKEGQSSKEGLQHRQVAGCVGQTLSGGWTNWAR